MKDCIESFGEAQMLSALGALWRYWQISIRDEENDQTTFISPLGVYCYTQMPFDDCNTPAQFQRALDTILSGVRRKK